MKILKKILVILLIIIAIPLIVALFVPKDYKSEGEIVINKPKQEVFDHIKYVKNQDRFGVWQLSDPNMTTTSEGTDGTVGFKYSWDSEKLGKGAQVITKLIEGERMESDMFFLDFNEDANRSYFSVEEKSSDETLVKWGIEGKSPYPWNLMSLFYSMDKDFKKGLENLKEILEAQESPKSDTAILLDYYQETLTNINTDVSGLSEAQLHFKASDSTWSVSQCLEHIIITENMIFEMVKGYMGQPINPERRDDIKVSDQEIITNITDRSEKYKAPEMLVGKGKYNDGKTTIGDLENQRAEVLAFIKDTPIEELRNRVNDSPAGATDAYQSLLFMAGHSARHTLQIEEIIKSSHFPKN